MVVRIREELLNKADEQLDKALASSRAEISTSYALSSIACVLLAQARGNDDTATIGVRIGEFSLDTIVKYVSERLKEGR
jgi:hypothetical protein